MKIMKESLKMRATVTMGKWKGVPLKWQVVQVEEQKALLVCKKVVDLRPFEKPSSESLWEYEIWEKTDLRRWLNDTFFNKAFKTEEKFRIVQSEIVTKVYREGMCIKTEKTMDHVFILSAGELLRYVTGKGRSCRTLTSDEEYWEQSSSYSAFTGNVGYWLRSRGDDFMSSYWPVDYADQFGELYYNEGNPLELRGVRPAVWIETENHG